jgi:hypothetical protein
MLQFISTQEFTSGKKHRGFAIKRQKVFESELSDVHNYKLKLP